MDGSFIMSAVENYSDRVDPRSLKGVAAHATVGPVVGVVFPRFSHLLPPPWCGGSVFPINQRQLGALLSLISISRAARSRRLWQRDAAERPAILILAGTSLGEKCSPTCPHIYHPTRPLPPTTHPPPFNPVLPCEICLGNCRRLTSPRQWSLFMSLTHYYSAIAQTSRDFLLL